MIRSFLSVRSSDCDVLFRDIVSLPPAKKIGRIDIACGCVGNHTHVMGPEELRRAALTKTRLQEKWGVPTRTMIMADNPGLSWSIVKPFAEAGIENVIFAPNQWNPIPSTLRQMNRTIPAATWNPDARGGGNYIDVSYDSERPMVFGLNNPGGKLPISFPRGEGAIPCYYHALKDRANYVDVEGGARYPFGYGLSYTTSG